MPRIRPREPMRQELADTRPIPSQARPSRLRWSRLRWAQADPVAVLEFLGLVFAARLMVLFCFRAVAGWALRVREPGSAAPPPQLERRVRRAVWLVPPWLPWTNVCLANAIAAKTMLARRGFSSTIHLGVGTREGGELHAHAWLEAGGGVIVGEQGMRMVKRLPQEARPT